MALVAVEQITEQSDTTEDAPHDDVDEGSELCDAELLSSLGSLGSSLLPGVLGSLGLLPEPPPPVSPPPPGGQKGHIHEGP